MAELKAGDNAPRIQLKNHEGADFDSKNLLGTTIVLFFYPKADTPG